ncbi:hypothetical protein [Achromobacter sp. DH1f]|uniref:hypothetical protein n=1 Tax=Achromobacter sp. DH1f TaxID=1397275 RepID=UPI00046A2701|nr:hypothetical protein [Achromobacter sp. DH1f]
MSKLQNSSGALSRGDLEVIIHRGRTGKTERCLIKNLFTDDGLAYLAARSAGESVAVISHMALGIGTTPAAGTDKTLASEIVGSRVPVTISGVGPQRLYTATFGEGVGSGPVTEAGLFNAATVGLMTNRSVFGVKNKEPEDVFTINWTLAQQRG